ncbi:Rhodanese-like domain-containing protein [Durotheca rogersii]|uniref:Rhodanese-like domain-containing protein n=1 Tax=Durotheca rogersii TaxID=419775 RepID=UPI00221F578C|nr:Rhodanese-like domain-containing protein [Durotheca rogersii]KAI5861890.1 Rhodanese-like domain-containing protein [Durotheca rogersii]
MATIAARGPSPALLASAVRRAAAPRAVRVVRIAAALSSSSRSSRSSRSNNRASAPGPIHRLAAATTTPRTVQLSAIAAPAPAPGVRRSSSSSAGDPPGAGKTWTFEEVQALTQSGSGGEGGARAVLIDVREPDELAQTGRIPGALNVPVGSAPDSWHVSAAEFRDRFGFERPSAPAPASAPASADADADADADPPELVFYCKAGVRSRAAAQIAREAGFPRVAEYPGSWNEWAARGGAVER